MLRPTALPPALVLALVLLSGCGGDSHADDAPEKSAHAMKHEGHAMRISPPDPNTLEGQHGGFFNVGLRTDGEYAGPETLAKDSRLYRDFQVEAAKALDRFTWEGVALTEHFAHDAKAKDLWTAAMAAPVVGDSRRNAAGDWIVVVKADVLPLTRYLRTGQ